MSNFKDVWNLNEMFNVEKTERDSVDWEIIQRQLEIIEEEFNELKSAVNQKDWEELKDACGDVLVTTYGMGYRSNIDCDKLMQNISESNFSKVCKTEDEVLSTCSHYNDMDCKVYVEQTELDGQVVWAVKSAEDQTYIDNGVEKTIPKGKFLKNINWKSPDLNVEL